LSTTETSSSHAYGIGIIAVIIALSLTISWYTMFWLPEENQKVFVDEHILNPSGQTTINIIDGASSPEQEDNYIPKLMFNKTIDVYSLDNLSQNWDYWNEHFIEYYNCFMMVFKENK
jgi:hypothetical protein